MARLLLDLVLAYWFGSSARIKSNEVEYIYEKVDLWRIPSLWECAGLIVKEYSKLGYMGNHTSSRLKIFFCYYLRRQIVFRCTVEGELQATLALIPDNGLLPSEGIFPEVGALRQYGKIAELGNLARNPSLGQGRISFEPIMTLALRWAMHIGVKTCFLSAIPSHGAFYQRSGFKHLANGESRPHPKVNNIMGVGMVIDLMTAECNSYTGGNLRKYIVLTLCTKTPFEVISPVAIPW